jgi:hypothetical protein
MVVIAIILNKYLQTRITKKFLKAKTKMKTFFTVIYRY